MKLLKYLFISAVLFFFNSSCKHNDCYDESLYQKNKNTYCTQDCPGVIGCDGKTYCNECIAHSKGIRVK